MDDGSYKVKVQARGDSFGVVTIDILTKNVAKPLLLFICCEIVTRNSLPLRYLRALSFYELGKTANMCKQCL